ncbi:MAG: DUF3987 domain-containing protein [Potamolinea sp.]
MNSWKEASKSNPCPLCNKPDWCNVSDTGKAVLCRRIESPPDGWNLIKKSKDGSPIFAMEERKTVRPKQTRSWAYCGRDGQPLVRVWRIDEGEGEKPVRWQEHWDGRWVKGLEGIRRQDVPIYRYKEVQNAITNNQTIFIVEGEVCADALWDLGLAATTNIGGAGNGKWTDSDTEDLAGADVVLCPDRDEPGMKHMESIAKSFPEAQWLLCFPNSFTWKKLPRSQGVDIADWISDYKLTAEDIQKAVQPNKASFLANSTEVPTKDNLLQKIESLINRNLLESQLQKELLELSKEVDYPVQTLWALHNTLAQELERKESLDGSLTQFEGLLSHQIKSQQINWDNLFPAPLMKALNSKSEAARIQPIFLIQNLLPAIGGLIGSGTGIIAKEGDGENDHWIEYPNLWTATIAPPSAGKSVANRAIFSPIRRMQNKEADRYENAKLELAAIEEKWELTSKEEKKALADELDNPAVYRETIGACRKYLLSEGEIEAIKRRLSEQPPAAGSSWVSDELLGLFRGLDQYKSNGRGNARQFLLDAWTGPLWTDVERVSDGESFRFKGQILNLCGGIQVELAAQFFNPDGKNTDADGLQSRILVAAPALHKDFDIWSDVKVSLDSLLEDLFQKVQRLPKGLISLSPQAKLLWQKQWETYRRGARKYEQKNPAFSYFLGKMCSNLMRLTVVLHSIEHCYTPKFDFLTLETETLKKAIAIADYYISQFRLVQTKFTDQPEQGMSEFLMNILNFCLKEGSLAPYQVVDRWRRKPGKGGKSIRAAEVKEMFAVIAEARPQQVKFDGKKLFALENPDRVLENPIGSRSGDRANKPLKEAALTQKHDQHDRLLEEKSVIFDDFSLEDRSCLYVKSTETLTTPTENDTIGRSCSDRVFQKPDRVSTSPLKGGELSEPPTDQGSSSTQQGFEAVEKPDRVFEKPDRVSEKPDRVSEKTDRVSEKTDRVSEKTDDAGEEDKDKPEFNKTDHGWKPCGNRVGKFATGNTCTYKRSGPEGAIKVTCGRHKLSILAFRRQDSTVEALVKRSTWGMGYWIPLSCLES